MIRFKSLKSFLVAGVFMATAVFSGFSPVVMAASDLTADFTQLNQSQIVYGMGAGWNLGNQLEAVNNGTPSETAWGNPTISRNLIQKVKEAGFKSIRIPVSYFSKIGSAPNYTVDAAWLARIKEVVDYAYSQGMYVIINMHGDGYTTIPGSWLLVNSSDQATIKVKYQKVWQQIAAIFLNYDEHLIFESMNEEFDGNYSNPNPTYYANLNAYNQIFVDTVRQTGGNNSARWLLIPGWNTNIDYTVGNYGFVLPADTYRSSSIPVSEKRIMISAHYYSPWDFCGEESGAITQWGTTAKDQYRKSTWGQEDYMESQLKAMYDKFVTQGYPVVIGEFGSVDKTSADSTNNTYREVFANKLCSYCKIYGSVPVIWDNGYNGAYGLGLFNRSTLAVTQQGIINAVMSGVGQGPSHQVITPSTAVFDTSYPADIRVTVDQSMYPIIGIKNGSVSLLNGVDFAISGNSVTIYKNYLVKQASGTIKLTFDFSGDGIDPELTITRIDSGIFGDVNGDRVVDALDYALLKQHLLGKATLTADSVKLADLNKDNTVDAIDLAIFKMYLLGQVTSLPKV